MTWQRSADAAPPTPVAAALRPALDARDLDGMARAARELAARCPDARTASQALALLVREAEEQIAEVELSAHTVPVSGRRAAAVQLRMANFEVASGLYEELLRAQPGDRQLAAVVAALRDLEAALTGAPSSDAGTPEPWLDEETEVVEPAAGPAGGVDAALRQGPSGEVTRLVRDPLLVYDERTRAVPLPEGAAPSGGQASPDAEVTRAVDLDELPLAAFGDEVTQQRQLEPPPGAGLAGGSSAGAAASRPSSVVVHRIRVVGDGGATSR